MKEFDVVMLTFVALVAVVAVAALPVRSPLNDIFPSVPDEIFGETIAVYALPRISVAAASTVT